jgi:hypothetical protein
VLEDLLDQGEHVGVFHGVDLASAVAAGGDEAGEAELGQVLTDGRDGGADAFCEGADVVFVAGQQPDHMQAGGR